MKKITSYFRFVLPVLLIASFLFANAPEVSAATILSESFGTGSTNSGVSGIGWSEGGNTGDDAELRASGGGNDSASPDGGRFAVMFGEDGYICRTIDATGYENLTLSYHWRGDSDAESNDDGIVEYKAGGGNCSTGSWPDLQNHDLSIDSSWSTQSAFSLPEALDDSVFNIRFRVDSSEDDEHFRVDGVLIEGDEIVIKTDPTLSVTNSPVVYNGTPQSATVTGSTPGVVSNIKYDGSSTAPTNAGTYAVTADFVPTDTVNYNNLSDASAGNFIIEPAPVPTTGSIQITKYACPEGTTVVRSVNGVGGTVPEGCTLQEGKTFGYVHGEQSDTEGPYPELEAELTDAGSTNGSGVLTISELPASGRYLIVETDGENQQLPANEVLGLYCTGDGDLSDNNDNQELTFVTADSTVHCVAYNEVPVVTPPTEDVTVTIVKYLDEEGYTLATSENTDNASFGMTATWDAENIGAGSGDFALDADGFNGDPTPYQAITSEMTSGADYSVVENLGTSCTEENDGEYILVGYKIGDSIEGALESEIQEVASLENITSNKFIIVINEKCTYVPPLACDADAEVILNGGFENGIGELGSFITLNGGDETSITNWAVGGEGVDYIGSYWQAQEGSRSIDLNAVAGGSVSQTITTEIGKTYVVTFYLSGNPDNNEELASPALKEVSVGATGNDAETFTYDTEENGNSTSDMKWEENTYTFTATETSTTITFESEIDGAFGPALDNVSVKVLCPITGTLIVEKVIVGSDASATNFSFSVNESDPIYFESDGQNDLTKDVGTYSVVETGNENYNTTYSNSSNEESNCDNLNVTEEGTVTCTITNTYIDEPEDNNNEEESSTITSSGSRIRTGSVLGASTGGQVLGEETSCGLTLELGKFMKKGYAGNDKAQVSILQQFLKDYLKLPDFVVDGIFGDETEVAVKQFQAMPPHNENILKPWGLTEPTGVVYITTIIEINNVKCAELNIPIPPTLVPFGQ